MEYKEIKRYYSSLYILTYRIGGLGESEISEDGFGKVFPSWETLYGELEKHPASEMCEELEILATTNSEEQFKRILKDLFVVTTQFDDRVLDGFNDLFSDVFAVGEIKVGEKTSCIDVERVREIVGEKYADRVSEMIQTTEEHLDSLLFSFYKIIHAHLDKWSDIKREMETAHTEMEGEGVEIKFDRLFAGSPVGHSMQPIGRRKGRKRKEPTLNVYQTCLYLRHLLNAERVESGILGDNQAEDARILSAMCGGERSGFDTALKKTFEAFWVAKDDKEKQKKIGMQIEEIKGIINRKEE